MQVEPENLDLKIAKVRYLTLGGSFEEAVSEGEKLRALHPDDLRVAGVLSPTSRRFEVMDSVSAFEVAWFEAQEIAPETEGGDPTSTQDGTTSDETPARIGEIAPDWTLPVPNPSPTPDSIPPIDTLGSAQFAGSG